MADDKTPPWIIADLLTADGMPELVPESDDQAGVTAVTLEWFAAQLRRVCLKRPSERRRQVLDSGTITHRAKREGET